MGHYGAAEVGLRSGDSLNHRSKLLRWAERSKFNRSDRNARDRREMSSFNTLIACILDQRVSFSHPF